jgi:DnaJ-class molecular chaperone
MVCPEHALTLAAAAENALASAPEPITCHRLRLCQRCEDEFAARGEEEVCPACAKDADLFAYGFSTWSHEK